MSTPEIIEVWADWEALGGPSPIGRMLATFSRGNQIFSFPPAYDVNPDAQGEGLKLNILDTDNAQNLELLMGAAALFRVAVPPQGSLTRL